MRDLIEQLRWLLPESEFKDGTAVVTSRKRDKFVGLVEPDALSGGYLKELETIGSYTEPYGDEGMHPKIIVGSEFELEDLPRHTKPGWFSLLWDSHRVHVVFRNGYFSLKNSHPWDKTEFNNLIARVRREGIDSKYIHRLRKTVDEVTASVNKTVQESEEKLEKPKYMKWHLGLAHDKLYSPAQFWIHHPSRHTKKGFIDAWRELSPQEKAAHADDIKAAFAREHGGEHATVYRRKSPAVGGSSVSADKPHHMDKGQYKTYRIHHSDTIAHYGQKGLPFGNKSFGHEKEIVLHPDANPVEIEDD